VQRLLNNGVSDQVVKVLRKIVNTEEGTAKFANVPNYEIGGKTGTADKVLNGIYSDDAKVKHLCFNFSNFKSSICICSDARCANKI
jgi:cell division protein FtsI/penicillin-binding protein 2